jgi:NAD+ synthase
MMQDWNDICNDISKWILDYASSNGISTLVVGVSGGIDSAVTSALCARTGLRTMALNMPIHQDPSQYDLSNQHISWLTSNWENVDSHVIDLSKTYDSFEFDMNSNFTNLSLANSRARLRMATLYNFASTLDGIVVGTGNKVEDFGVGFFTKYGDGGVDISPLADMYKSEVYSLADALGIIQEIQDAAPTDGLWTDGRTDEDQLGASYEELEWAMKEMENPSGAEPTVRQSQVMERYLQLNSANSHKMKPIPVFKRNH